MRIMQSITRHALTFAVVILGLGACAANSTNRSAAQVRSALVQVDVYDRANGAALSVYHKDGRHYIVGTPGHEYAVRIRNCSGARVLVVTSVDGVNVISGETASPAQSGYVLEPWGSVEIKGWRKNLQRTAAFFFTEHQNSYAARTGRPDHVGVIGVAVFREKTLPVTLYEPRRRGPSAPERRDEASAEFDTTGSRADAPAAAAAPRESAARDELKRQEAANETARLLGKLGTGHGRNESSHATVVRFERASETPAETVTIQYDRSENLAAIGVLPTVGQFVRRNPEPFPAAMRFAPDPKP
jgi:hypothetical protein